MSFELAAGNIATCSLHAIGRWTNKPQTAAKESENRTTNLSKLQLQHSEQCASNQNKESLRKTSSETWNTQWRNYFNPWMSEPSARRLGQGSSLYIIGVEFMPKNETGSFVTDFAQENEESSVKSLPTITFCNSNHQKESESEAQQLPGTRKTAAER
jgi:hypothetical protein